jgi:hypothetical protein
MGLGHKDILNKIFRAMALYKAPQDEWKWSVSPLICKILGPGLSFADRDLALANRRQT